MTIYTRRGPPLRLLRAWSVSQGSTISFPCCGIKTHHRRCLFKWCVNIRRAIHAPWWRSVSMVDWLEMLKVSNLNLSPRELGIMTNLNCIMPVARCFIFVRRIVVDFRGRLASVNNGRALDKIRSSDVRSVYCCWSIKTLHVLFAHKHSYIYSFYGRSKCIYWRKWTNLGDYSFNPCRENKTVRLWMVFAFESMCRKQSGNLSNKTTIRKKSRQLLVWHLMCIGKK